MRYRHGRRVARGARGQARCCSRPARSIRRSSSNCPASAGRDVLARPRHRGRARPARRRREPAGPSADPHGLQGHRRQDAQPARSTAGWARLRMALAVCARRSGPMSMAPSQFGIFTRSRPSGRDARSRVPRPAAVDRQARRSAASLPGGHGVGLQPAAGEPRHRAMSTSRDPAEQPAIRPNYLSTRARPATSRSRRSARRARS